MTAKLNALAAALILVASSGCTWRNGGYSYGGQDSRRSHRYLGTLSSNKYDADSVSNPYGTYGSPYSAKSVNNKFGPYGNPYSAKSINNPYTQGGPKIFAQDGTYLGTLNSNPYDADSVSNPYGRYGSRYSSDSINNPYGRYGSPYSSESARNPYASRPPVIVDDD